MEEKKIRELIQQGRDFLRPVREENLDFESDQMLKKPQPPLVKEPMREESIALPLDFENLEIDNDFLHVINSRKSHRVYTQEKMTIRQLSYLLWCSQGVKGIRGKSYATLRTVPCGGARHEFECYMAIQNVDGLQDGLYHYLPMNHRIELLSDDLTRDMITASLQQQAWASRANAVFYFSFVAYRAEWRYGILAHRMIMADAGHITENLYLAATSISLGGCAIGSVDGKLCNGMFELDGEEEYVIYAMSVGTVSEKDSDKEADFYSFVEKEGL